MNDYEDLIDRLTNGTDMPDYDEGAFDWYSHITDEAADAIKKLVAERDELVAALKWYAKARVSNKTPGALLSNCDDGAYARFALAKVGAGKTGDK